MTNYAGNPHVSDFTINVKGGLINKTCTLQRTASHLKCPFTGLLSGSKYTVRAVACNTNQGVCSKTSKLTTWTIPQGMVFTDLFGAAPPIHEFCFKHYISAPAFVLHQKNLSAVVVEVQKPDEDLAIALYRAKIKNGSPKQACTIMACINPLICEISGLMLGANYTVEVKACVWGESSCSAGTELGVSVKPTGKWKTMLHFGHSIQNSGFDSDTVVPH